MKVINFKDNEVVVVESYVVWVKLIWMLVKWQYVVSRDRGL